MLLPIFHPRLLSLGGLHKPEASAGTSLRCAWSLSGPGASGFYGTFMRISPYTVASVLDLLREGQLLGPDELRALEDLQRRYRGGPSELVRAILKRGWLTAYQAQELFAGRGRELLVGGYVVLAPLGEGSTARVFKARSPGSGRVVALKVLHGQLPDEAVHRWWHE